MRLNLVFTRCHSPEEHTSPFQRGAFIWATFSVSRYYYDNTLSLLSTPTPFAGEVKASWAVSQQHLLKPLSVQRYVLNHRQAPASRVFTTRQTSPCLCGGQRATHSAAGLHPGPSDSHAPAVFVPFAWGCGRALYLSAWRALPPGPVWARQATDILSRAQASEAAQAVKSGKEKIAWKRKGGK